MSTKVDIKKNTTDVKIRVATPADATELLKIYEPYVKNTAITFEYEVPSIQEFAGRIENTLKRYPYLVASINGKIMGYAYVSPFKTRAAYDWAVETSIYVSQEERGHGIGRRLYDKLEEILKKQNILNLNACIAYPEVEDEHLTKQSVQFHEHLGYRLTGEFTKCGYKFNRWYNMVWMEKLIGEHVSQQPAVKTFKKVMEEEALAYLQNNIMLHMGMIEPILRGTAQIVGVSEKGVLIHDNKSMTYMLTAEDEETARDFLSRIQNKSEVDLFVCHQEQWLSMIEEMFPIKRTLGCHQAIYLKKDKFLIPEEYDIRQLDQSYAQIVHEHYKMVDDLDYIKGRIEEGVMHGAFVDGELAGFAGMHDEGTMGLLEVFPQYQRRGIGLALEKYMINYCLDHDYTPFDQVVEGNDKSISLQKKVGMTIGKEPLFWLEKVE